tara:strand:- start:3890 stop:4051 length:162 start_codon:yes stop_codon:yes gene_type:complete
VSIETNIRWIPSEAHWAVYDEASIIVGFYITYGEAIQAYKDYCKANFPELYNE